MDGDEASEEVRSVQVSYPRQFFKVPGSSHRRVYFLRHQNYNILCICHPPSLPLGLKFNVTQSRECQKKAWKLTHKYKCIPNTLSAREEALLKPLRRVVDAWQKRWENVLDVFSILALDLENNPGKNKTHWSVLHSVMTFSSRDLFFFFFRLVCGSSSSTRDAEPILRNSRLVGFASVLSSFNAI